MKPFSASPEGSARNGYYAAADSWAEDTYLALRRSRRTAWIVASALGTIAVLEALAILLLTPLKTAVPYVFTVDRQTGYVEAVRSLQPGALSQNAAVTQSYLVQYVLARETFDANDLRPAYRRVMLFSADPARARYEQEMRPSNPASPLKRYRRKTQVQVQVKSVSMLGPGSALVRFDTEQRDGEAAPQRASYAAVIGFRYSAAPMSMADRFDNPLGFQVTSYRRDAEAPQAVQAVATN